jgi:hypothetical protein
MRLLCVDNISDWVGAPTLTYIHLLQGMHSHNPCDIETERAPQFLAPHVFQLEKSEFIPSITHSMYWYWEFEFAIRR